MSSWGFTYAGSRSGMASEANCVADRLHGNFARPWQASWRHTAQLHPRRRGKPERLNRDLHGQITAFARERVPRKSGKPDVSSSRPPQTLCIPVYSELGESKVQRRSRTGP